MLTKTKKTKTDRSKLKKKLEILVKSYVKLRDNNTCQYCGKYVEGSDCHASHVKNVARDGRLAFDDLNIKVLCYHHHINWWHKDPLEAARWFESKFPDRMKYLEEQYKENRSLGTIPISFYEEKIEIYKKKIQEWGKNH